MRVSKSLTYSAAVRRNEEDVFLRVCLSEYDTRIRRPSVALEPVSDVKHKNAKIVRSVGSYARRQTLNRKINVCPREKYCPSTRELVLSTFGKVQGAMNPKSLHSCEIGIGSGEIQDCFRLHHGRCERVIDQKAVPAAIRMANLQGIRS